MSNNVFPQATTLVRNWLNTGASSRAELLRYLMGVYAHPLNVYFLGSSYRNLGEAEDFVHGFFVSYLAKDGYLEKWNKTDKRLRHWLANGLLFYCRDRLNERRRHRGESIDDSEPASPPPETLRRYELELKAQVVRAAIERASQECRSRGLGQHWDLFELYHLRNVPLERIAVDSGVTSERAWVMVRTAQRTFTKIVREIVAADIDSTDPAKIDQELESF